MIALVLFFGILGLIGWGFGRKGLRVTLVTIAILFIFIVVLAMIGSQSQSNTATLSVSNSPTPTINPNPTWHTVYTLSGGNGDTQTDNFPLKGKKWKLDYQTYNAYGVLSISGQGIDFIDVAGLVNTSMPGVNMCLPDQTDCTDTLHISSSDQNYKIEVEDYY